MSLQINGKGAGRWPLLLFPGPGAQVGAGRGISEASCIARRKGPLLPLACRWLGSGSPSSAALPRTRFPGSRLDEIPWQPQLLGTPRGWTCPPATTGGCLLDGELMPRSLAGRG